MSKYDHLIQTFNKSENRRPILFIGRYYAAKRRYDKGGKEYSDTVFEGLTPLNNL